MPNRCPRAMLGNYNEEMASEREQRAEKMLAKSQHWLDVANDL